MNKNRIRLTESQLRRVVKESVKKVLKEGRFVNNIPLDKYFSDKEKEVKEPKKPYVGNLAGKLSKAYYDDNDSEVDDALFDYLHAFNSYNSRKALANSRIDKIRSEKDIAQGKHNKRYFNKLEKEDTTPFGNHLLSRKALFALKQCEHKFSVELNETNTDVENLWGVTIGYGPGCSYRVVTSSYADGPDSDYSKEINEFLTQHGFEFAGKDSTGFDETMHENWIEYYWAYRPMVEYDY